VHTQRSRADLVQELKQLFLASYVRGLERPQQLEQLRMASDP
jgi:hypothetical protein